MLSTWSCWQREATQMFLPLDQRKAFNCTAIWRAHRRDALFGNLCITQIHLTCIPLSSEHQFKLTLMSESPRNDGRVWVSKRKWVRRALRRISRKPSVTTIWRAATRVWQPRPRDVASQTAKEVCDERRGTERAGCLPGLRGCHSQAPSGNSSLEVWQPLRHL